ncbi:MAG: hypothetical protein AAF514_02670, partial [Verrucomicrobiota bacterium]
MSLSMIPGNPSSRTLIQLVPLSLFFLLLVGIGVLKILKKEHPDSLRMAENEAAGSTEGPIPPGASLHRSAAGPTAGPSALRPNSSTTLEAQAALKAALKALSDGDGEAPWPQAPVPPDPVDQPDLRPRPAHFSPAQLARLAQLRWQSGKHLEVRSFNPNSTIDFLRGSRLEAPAEPEPGESIPHATARRFLASNAELLLLSDPSAELSLVRESVDTLGFTQLRFEQRYNGLRVWPAGITVQARPDGQVHLLTGAYIPTPETLGLNPALGKAEAERLARVSVDAPLHRKVAGTEMIVHGTENDPALAYKVELHGEGLRHWTVVVDATDGTIRTRFNRLCTAAT